MAEVTIYATMFCPYCARARRLLDSKGVKYTEIDVDVTAGARDEMMKKAGGRRTVPQIFIGGRHVGGSDDLHALDREGKLDAMLAA
jgi:glutaredoxin 3